MEERIEIISKTILEFQDSGRTSNDALARIIIGNLEDNGYELKKLSQHDVRQSFLMLLNEQSKRILKEKKEHENNIFISTNIDGQIDMLSVVKEWVKLNFA